MSDSEFEVSFAQNSFLRFLERRCNFRALHQEDVPRLEADLS